jgi:hypothetical protein
MRLSPQCFLATLVALMSTFWIGGGLGQRDLLKAEEAGPPIDSPHTFTVLTQNLYQGADLTPLILAPSPQNVELVVSRVVQTSFPERAKWLVDEIEETQPLLIGLQEVSLWRSQTPGDFLTGNFAPKCDVRRVRLPGDPAGRAARPGTGVCGGGGRSQL